MLGTAFVFHAEPLILKLANGDLARAATEAVREIVVVVHGFDGVDRNPVMPLGGGEGLVMSSHPGTRTGVLISQITRR